MAAAILLAAAGRSALALDSSRTLTQYVHRIWQTQPGLPEASIYSILQTRDGYLWLGTLQGLVRFDGVTFTPLETIYPGAPSDVWIRSMIQDSTGALWVGTNETGVFRLENGVFTHFSQKNGLPSDVIQCLVPGDHGEIWICTSNGLARFDNGKFEVYRTAQGLSSNIVRAAAYILRRQALGRRGKHDPERLERVQIYSVPLETMPKDAGVRAIVTSGDTLWIGTTEGLIQRVGGKERRYTTKDGLSDDWILAMAASRDGSLWIGTRNGFSRWHKGEIDSFRPQDGLSQSTVYSVFEDREGSLWIGTKHGLNQFLDGRAVPYTVNEGLPSNDTGPVIQDHAGTIWVGTLGAGLSRFDGRRFSDLTTKNGLASNQIDALAEDGQGNLWVGTDRGLNRLRDGRVVATYTAAQGLPANDVKSILSDAQGRLWVGTAAGPAMFRDGKFARPTGLSLTQAVVAMGEDSGGRLYIATANGVLIFDNGKLTEMLQDNAPMRSVDTFYRDRDGIMWIGMLGGPLRMVQNGRISNVLMRDGLFDSEIYGITTDAQDRLWMACSKGIFSVPRADLLAFAAGKIRKIVSTPYSPTDALRVIECKPGVQPAVSLMKNGDLWFSTIRGLIVIDPNHLLRNVPPPPIVIEDVIVNGEHELPAHIARLAPGRKNIEIQLHRVELSGAGKASRSATFSTAMTKTGSTAGTRRSSLLYQSAAGNFPVPGDGVQCRRSLQRHRQLRGVCAGVAILSAGVVLAAGGRHDRAVHMAGVSASHPAAARAVQPDSDGAEPHRARTARHADPGAFRDHYGDAGAGRKAADPEERDALQDIIQDAGTCLRETRRSGRGAAQRDRQRRDSPRPSRRPPARSRKRKTSG